jgi:hypothetical protein
MTHEPLTCGYAMKLRTASLLAIIGTAVVIAGSIINVIRNVTVAGHLPPFFLMAVGPALVF